MRNSVAAGQRFREALTEHRRAVQSRRSGEREVFDDVHVPDAIYATIQTEQDFMDFLSFLRESRGTDLYEWGDPTASDFVRELARTFGSPDMQGVMTRTGVNHPYGRVAYAILVALGNPMNGEGAP